MKSCSRLLGVSKFDFLIVVIIFGVLATALFARIDQVQADAERAEVDLTIRNIRVGLQLAVSELVMAGRDGEIRALGQRNPFGYLDAKPKGYEGERSAPSGPGLWGYDPTQAMVLYRPRLAAAFDGRTLLRWQLRAVAAPTDKMPGLRIEALE